jgi:hypothetical protein
VHEQWRRPGRHSSGRRRTRQHPKHRLTTVRACHLSSSSAWVTATRLHGRTTATTYEKDLATGTGIANIIGLPLLLPRCRHMINALGEQPYLLPLHLSSSTLMMTSAITSTALGDRRKTSWQPSSQTSWFSRGMECHGPRSGLMTAADHLSISIKIYCQFNLLFPIVPVTLGRYLAYSLYISEDNYFFLNTEDNYQKLALNML